MKIGIIGKTNQEKTFEIAAKICELLADEEAEVYLADDLAKKINGQLSAKPEDIPELVDLILVLGGDGTFLGVARLACKYGTPILGINLGNLGFLTEITVDEVTSITKHILSQDYEIEKRKMLRASIKRDNEIIESYDVLNDVVINKGAVARVVDLSIYIDGQHLTTYKADGIILSTPTGSTAYSLSAGGPIVHPGLPVIIVTPICPHTLTNRPLIVSSDMKVEIKISTNEPDTYLTLDGQIGVKLESGDSVEVHKSDSSIRLIKSPFRDFFNILKTKLMWGERYGKNKG